LAIAGSVSLSLGVIGVVLPGLPTTPFVLLAAACYAKASPRLHQWLLNHRWMGPMLRDWEANRRLTRRTKTVAVLSMVVMVHFSIWTFREWLAVQGVLLAADAIGAWVVLRIPTRRQPSAPSCTTGRIRIADAFAPETLHPRPAAGKTR
jgi:uncharacterized protein